LLPPKSQYWIIRADPYNSLEDAVQFRLTYEGLLFASRTEDKPARASHKQDIRRVFHRQLKELWIQTPHLAAAPNPDTGFLPQLPDLHFGEVFPKGYSRARDLADRFKCGAYNLVPLVTKDLSLICGLDILLLRPGNPGETVKRGDVDNRVKTLVDALRIPGPDIKELGGQSPQDGENPFYCLLEDDALINHLAIETDRLLQPIEGIPHESSARAIITVRVRPAEVMLGNLNFA
jgi:hypothetical protein